MIYPRLYGWDHQLMRSPEEIIRKRNSNRPKLSIVIPTLNQGETIGDTLLSIINQDYHDFEIIVMDGGSIDNTLEIISKYQNWIDVFCSGKDGGQSNAINNGFKRARGDIYAWINSDDYYMPNAFSKVVNVFSGNPEVDIVVGSGNIVSKDHRFLRHIASMPLTREDLLDIEKDKWIMQQTCFWKTSIWHRSGGVDEELELLMDFDLWLRFAMLGLSKTLDDDIAVMRYYSEAKTVTMKQKMKEELGYVYAKNTAPYHVQLLIHGLLEKNKDLSEELDRRNQKLITRVLKRFRFEL